MTAGGRFAERPGSQGSASAIRVRAIEREDECTARSDPYVLPTLRSANCSDTDGTARVAKGQRLHAAPDGCTAQCYTVVCHVPGTGETLAERKRDRALLEIHSTMRVAGRGRRVVDSFPSALPLGRRDPRPQTSSSAKLPRERLPKKRADARYHWPVPCSSGAVSKQSG